MTANSVRSQENRQNTQLHPKDDPNIAFHHTFKALLPSNSKQVYIMEGNNIIFKIPIKVFWNSAQCFDRNYYTINTLDLENSTTSKEYVVRNPSLKTYSENSNYFNSYEVIGDVVLRGADENVRSEPFIIKGKQIPELERNYKIKYHKEMQFPFVKANQADGCKVLTVQENEQSDRKFDLPSVACKHDNGKITCSKFGTSYNIPKPENSATYYMTTTKDLNNNYKFYFSDKDGNKTNDLKLSLSDIRITEEALLKHLELDHNLKKLQTKAQTIETHLKNDTDSFEKGTAKTITSNLEKNAVQAKLANSLSQNTRFIQNVKDNAGISPSAVAELLLESKGPELGNAILNAIVSRTDDNADRVLSRLARDTTLQSEVAKDLKEDSIFQVKIKGKDGEAGPRGADGTPGQDAKPAEVAAKLFEQPVQLGQAVLNIKDVDQRSKLAVELASNNVLKEGVKDLLKDDIERDVGSLPRMARSVQEYEKQSQSYGKRVQEIEEKMEGEERKILEIKQEAISAATESMRHAQRSEDEANRSKTAADVSEGHAKRSKEAADESKEHAQRSETAASESGVHAKNSKTAANKAEGHAGIAVTAAGKAGDHAKSSKDAAAESRKHSTKAEVSSSNAAAFEENTKEVACAMNPSLSGCSSRSRREAIWEEPESEYENSELTLLLTDSVSVI